jgi:hypothetical protein
MKKERHLLSSCVLHSKTIVQEVEIFLSKCLGEDVYNMFGGCTTLQIDEDVMYLVFDVMHMDLDVFGPLSLHRVSTKLESTMIVTPNDSPMVEMDVKISEEVLKPNRLNGDVDCSSVLVLR